MRRLDLIDEWTQPRAIHWPGVLTLFAMIAGIALLIEDIFEKLVSPDPNPRPDWSERIRLACWFGAWIAGLLLARAWHKPTGSAGDDGAGTTHHD